MGTYQDPVRTVNASGLIAATNSGSNGNVIAVDRIKIVGASNASAANVLTITNASMGQATTVTVPDPGQATANLMLDAGITSAKTITTLTSTTANITDLLYGATPVHQVDPASCTITAAAGTTNTATVTVTLKDGAGVTLTRSIPFTVYASSAADGLTLASAASTGWSVASGGLSLNNAGAVTTSIRCISSAAGACVLSLLDTGKQTSYLVLVLSNGVKISAQLSAGSYG